MGDLSIQCSPSNLEYCIQGVCQMFDTEFPDFSLTFFYFSLTLDQHFINFFPGIYPLKSEIFEMYRNFDTLSSMHIIAVTKPSLY